MIFAPSLEGSAPIRTPGPKFLNAFRERVRAGLLSGQPHPRSNYVVSHAGARRLQVRAADWWTAIAVGLNDLDLQVIESGRVRYQVRYWRWAAYALALSGIIAATMAVVFLAMDLPGYIERHPNTLLPGFSVEQHVFFAWAMVAFWGFIWPWLLIAMHKRPVRRMLERLIAEVDSLRTPGTM
ncbi:MAG: hypothetical protein ACREV2_03755 [Burkholderiales bacterium]